MDSHRPVPTVTFSGSGTVQAGSVGQLDRADVRRGPTAATTSDAKALTWDDLARQLDQMAARVGALAAEQPSDAATAAQAKAVRAAATQLAGSLSDFRRVGL